MTTIPIKGIGQTFRENWRVAGVIFPVNQPNFVSSKALPAQTPPTVRVL